MNLFAPATNHALPNGRATAPHLPLDLPHVIRLHLLSAAASFFK
jgi:hypothetical protein